MTSIVLIGAGSLQFGAGMLGDIFQSEHLKDAHIILHDINADAAERTRAMAEAHIEARGLTHTLRVEADLPRALKDADFVVISIEVGDRFALWDLDWRIPQQYGIAQVYGENGGPGGLFHALRIIPPILDICAAISEHAPKATIFNYSNPMSRICTTVHRAFPDLTFIGMCHEIASLSRHLPELLNTPLDQLSYRAGGLNHFSVMTECAYADGRDAYPDVLARANDFFHDLPGATELLALARDKGEITETEGWMEVDTQGITSAHGWTERGLFKMILDRFRLLPITTDSHFGEYTAWAHDAVDHRGILDFYTFYRMQLGVMTPTISEHLHERVVPMIDAMVSGEAYVEAAVNIPNRGFIADLPDWIAVEVPARVDASGVHGEAVDVPAGIRGLLSNQVGIHSMTAEAILTKSRDAVVQALMVDPVVTKAKMIPQMVDHMIAEQSPWLDYLK